MQLFPRDRNIIVRADYSPEFTRSIHNVPNAEFKMWEWVVPLESWESLKANLQIEPAHCYPYLCHLVPKGLFPNVKATLGNDRLHVVAADPAVLQRLIVNMETLCGYEEVTEEYNRQEREYTYTKESYTLLERLRKEPNRIIWTFPPGLAYRIHRFLKDVAGIELLVKFKHDPVQPYLIFPGEPKYPARDYQAKIASQAPQIWNATIVKPTGSGKTRTAGEIIRTMRVNTLFITDADLLLKQTANAFTETLNSPIGRIGGGKFNIKPVTVATAQSLWALLTRSDDGKKLTREEKRAKMKDIKNEIALIRRNGPLAVNDKRDELLNYLATVDLQFVDEAHTLGAEYLFLVANLTFPHFSYGLTATPQREDEKGIYIEAVTGPVWRPVTEEELINAGYLLPVKVLVIPYRHQKKGKVRGRNFSKLKKAMITGNLERNFLVTDLSEFYSRKYKTLTLVNEIEHGQTLSNFLGVPFISSKDKSIQEQAIADLVEGKIRCLISSPILEQGVDIKEAEVLIDAIPRRSARRIIQAIGRVRRPGPGKTSAYVVTLFDMDDGVFLKQSLRKLHILQSAGFEIYYAAPQQIEKIRQSLYRKEG